jgi:hypothetical protein
MSQSKHCQHHLTLPGDHPALLISFGGQLVCTARSISGGRRCGGACRCCRGRTRRAAELAARKLTLPDAQSVEDLTALLTSTGER